MDNPYSSTFCVYPWMEMSIGPTPWPQVCCISTEAFRSAEGDAYNIGKDTLQDIWNSEGLRTIRNKMLKGEKVKSCSYCYYQESIKRKSYRENFNNTWLTSSHGEEIHRRVERSREENCFVDAPPLYLDLRLGNKCNLKCRMCNPGSSSKLYEEQKELFERKKLTSELIDTSHLGQCSDIFELSSKGAPLWREIDEWLSAIKKLYFTGGEPTLIEKNWKIIDKAVSTGYSKGIVIEFNVNCTYVPERLLATFSQFSRISLNLSIDGKGDVQEYIRHPSKWATIVRNLERILAAKKSNVDIFFTPVVQVYNILNLTSFLRWLDELSVKFKKPIMVDLILCTKPDFFNIASIPTGKMRRVVISDIEAFKKDHPECNARLVEQLDNIIHILTLPPLKNAHFLRKKFIRYTKILDDYRGNSFEKSLPRLNEFLQGHDAS